MDLARWQATIVDGNGNVIDQPVIQVWKETPGSPLAPIFSDREGLEPLSNPFTVAGDANGHAYFHAEKGVYRVRASYGAFSKEWRYVYLPGIDLPEPDSLTFEVTRNALDWFSEDTNWAAITPAEMREGLQSAINECAGSFELYIPPQPSTGEWLIDQELTCPDKTVIRGFPGSGTWVKLASGSATSNNVFTNANNDRTTANAGNSYISITDIHGDGNRTGVTGAHGGSTSGCVFGFSRVSWLRLKGCIAKSGAKHGIDINATVYGHGDDDSDDETYMPGPSQYVWIEDCVVTDCGDDNITTHNSDHIWIKNCYSYDPAGTYTTNSNCVEIDDGSRYIFIDGLRTKGGYSGLQIKGHEDAPAPHSVFVSNTVCEGSVINFNCYHEGHRGSSEPVSPTAHTLKFVNCHSVNPRYDAGVEGGNSTNYPRGWAISSFDGVYLDNCSTRGDPSVTGFTAIPTSVYNSAAFFGDKLKNCRIVNFEVRDHPHMSRGVGIDDDARGNISFSGLRILNSGWFRGIAIGNCADFAISDYHIVPPSSVTATAYGLLTVDTAPARLHIGNGYIASGYTVTARINGVNYTAPTKWPVEERGSGTITIADDAVATIPLRASAINIWTIIGNHNKTTTGVPRGILWMKGGGTLGNDWLPIGTLSNVAFTTGTLTGTTGTDGNFTISGGSDTLFLENRTGGTKNISLRLMHEIGSAI